MFLKCVKYGFAISLLTASTFVFADLTSDVKTSLSKDPNISSTNVSVTSKNGIVYVSGSVASDTEASLLVQDIQATNGVKDVDTSKLTVTSSKQPMTDTYITAKVKGAYIREKLFGDKDISVTGISVETNNGVVYLSGQVDSQEIANNAIRIAKTVNGVKSVESKIAIKS